MPPMPSLPQSHMIQIPSQPFTSQPPQMSSQQFDQYQQQPQHQGSGQYSMQYQPYQNQQQQHQSFQPMPQAPVPPPQSSYIAGLVSKSAQVNDGNSKPVAVNMAKPEKEFDDILKESNKIALAEDLDLIKQMTLLDDDDVLYTLYMKCPAFVNKRFYMSMLCMLYKEKYEALFAKYTSLSVFLEFVLAKIIFESEANLKKACASRTVRLPNSGGSGFAKLFGSRKRGAASEAPSENEIPNKTAKTIQHPFFNTSWYTTHSILYTIGNCCDYVVPSQFAELFAHVHSAQVTKFKAKVKESFDGLRITFSKPIVCIIVSKRVGTYQFLSLEHLESLGVKLGNLTSLGRFDDTFLFGTMEKMNLENIESNTITPPVKDHDYGVGYNMVVINSMNVFQLSNNTMSSKTYASSIYVLNPIELSLEEETSCSQYIAASAKEYEKVIEKYESDVQQTTTDS